MIPTTFEMQVGKGGEVGCAHDPNTLPTTTLY